MRTATTVSEAELRELAEQFFEGKIGHEERHYQPPDMSLDDALGWACGFYTADPEIPTVFTNLRPSEDERLMAIAEEELNAIEVEVRRTIIASAVRVGLRAQEELGVLPRGTLSASQPAPEPPPRPAKRLTLVAA